jgi:DNA invertase Pin-like site-specific DNA recombinase
MGPNVGPFMLHIYASLAEKERALISDRTKAALAAAKRGCRKLGTAGSVETAARTRAARSEPKAPTGRITGMTFPIGRKASSSYSDERRASAGGCGF